MSPPRQNMGEPASPPGAGDVQPALGPETEGDGEPVVAHGPTAGDCPGGGAAGAASRVRNTIFLSYSHADRDAEWYVDVQQYLRQLSVGGELQLWDDSAIQPGEDWRACIEQQLRVAKAAVFLVTPTFITSQFIRDEEVPRLLERQETEGLVVHALIAKPCDWQQHAIGVFLRSHQLCHSVERSLDEMEGPERRRILNELVKQIRRDIGLYRHRNREDHRSERIVELEERLGIAVDKEVAGGDSSIVYRAHTGQQSIAVKAMVSRPITDLGQADLRSEFEKCRGLRSPVFVRMFDLEFYGGHCVTTADWVPGHRLSRWLTVTRRSDAARRRWQSKVTAILCQLASALAEAHASGLRFLNIHPDKIRMHRDEPRMYPIDFSTYVAVSAHENGVFAFPINALEYIAPEHVSKPAEDDDPLAPGAANSAEARRRNELGDQYALAMVALAMLEGRPPVRVRSLADVARLMRFHADPRGYCEDGERPLEERPWRREIPGLARVIWRMLAPDPADRWNDMAEVHEQLSALQMLDFQAAAHASEAKASYTEHLLGNDAFYARFYERLFAAVPGVARLFGGSDMRRQRAMLDAAIERVLNFRPNQCEPTTLSAVARSHRHMGLDAAQFEAFGRAFIDTLAEEPGVSRDAVDAWEAVLWPAIEYLKREAVPRRPPSAAGARAGNAAP